MATAKNHTDNIDSVTLGNIETNSAFVKWFSTDYPISLIWWYVRQSITLLWNRAQGRYSNPYLTLKKPGLLTPSHSRGGGWIPPPPRISAAERRKIM